ncbi:uncharacterized protein PpBr36_06465 [Pyricularia pennisetigena]|uniref:uncharacterized protein n=1 Tax=Pyricularia pennisetigena TaxID=1578925 RepID=UPI001150A585|nr:uncharacterized protein PpBr36_06465 [Pyricularia pennisetigena]TLS23219.1 hypothetical protein PpBr36_06465 [Pyricularia pennisetigena]
MAFLVPSQADELKDEEVEDDEKSTRPLQDSHRPSKRRKTTGDVPSSSNYKTQTLTQLYSTAGSEEEKPITISDSEDDDDDVLSTHSPVTIRSTPTAYRRRELAGTPSAAPQTPSNRRSGHQSNLLMLSPSVRMLIRNSSPVGPRRSPLKDKSTNSAIRPSSLAKLKKRKKEREIPDSYSSDALSPLAPSQASPSKRRSPLKEIDLPPPPPPRSQNSPRRTASALRGTGHISSTPRPNAARRASRATNAEIPDSDDDLLSVASTPRRGENLSLEPETPIRSSRALFQRLVENKENTSPGPYVDPIIPAPAPQRGQSVGGTRRESRPSMGASEERLCVSGRPDLQQRSLIADTVPPDVEIGDSDSDLDSGPDSPCPPSRSLPSQKSMQRVVLGTSPAGPQSQGSKRGLLNNVVIASSSDISSSAIKPRAHPAEIPTSDGPQTTPLSSPEDRSTAMVSVKEGSNKPEESDLPMLPEKVTPRRRSPVKARSTQRYTQAHTQAYTQMLESQRVPMEVLRQMAPQTARSDIIVTMHPSKVKEIVDGIRNHDFRTVKLPRSVHRLWIYVARPVCELRYMATIGEPREPGEIESNTGLGNAEFNEGKTNAKWAYELEQVYVLNNPVSLERMKENGWTDSNASQRNKYLQPAIVGQLLSNLQCALFDDGLAEPATISQEIDAQILSDIAHSTQMAATNTLTAEEEVVESSQYELPAVTVPSSQLRRSARLAMPPPSSVNRVTSRKPAHQSSPSQWAAHSRAARSRKNVSFSQATTASQPSTQLPSTQAQSPEKPAPALVRSSSSVSVLPANQADSMPAKVLASGNATGSSSQIFPESLIRDDVRQPAIILDSEDESEMDDEDFF